MASISKQIASMVDMLPETDQVLAFELVRKLVLAWDPDFTKMTASEMQQIEQAESELAAGEYVPDSAINWN